MGDIISDDVVLKNGSDRKSDFITEISSILTALLTQYYLEQAMVSVQPMCSHPQTTHQIGFYLIRKTWTLIWTFTGVCSVGGKPLQTRFSWPCTTTLPRSTQFRESRSRSSITPLDSSRTPSHLAPDLPVLQSFVLISGRDQPFSSCFSFLTLPFPVKQDKKMMSHAGPPHKQMHSWWLLIWWYAKWMNLGPSPCPFWPPVRTGLPGNQVCPACLVEVAMGS